MKMMTTSVDNLRNSSNITSIRLINKVVEEVCAALPLHLRETAEDRTLCDQWSEECEYNFPSLSGGQLLSFENPPLGKFQAVGKKALFHISIKTLNVQSLAGMVESRWTEIFGPGISPKGSWWSLYKLPTEKRTADRWSTP